MIKRACVLFDAGEFPENHLIKYNHRLICLLLKSINDKNLIKKKVDKNWFKFSPFQLQKLTCFIHQFSTNVPLMGKPGCWFLLAKCLKNTCGRVIF